MNEEFDYYHANMIDDKKEETELKKLQKENQKKLKPYYNRNKKYLTTFKTWLKNQNNEENIIDSHLTNVKQYINTYLNYYPEKIKMEDGMSQIEKIFYIMDYSKTRLDWNNTDKKTYPKSQTILQMHERKQLRI